MEGSKRKRGGRGAVGRGEPEVEGRGAGGRGGQEKGAGSRAGGRGEPEVEGSRR